MGDLVGIVEAAYRLDEDIDAWLSSLCAAARPRFDKGLGIYAYRFDVSKPSRFEVRGLVAASDTVVAPQFVQRWHDMLTPQEISRIYRSPRAFAPITWRLGVQNHPAMARFCSALGVRDQLTLRAVDPTLEGISICSPTSESVFPTRIERHVWTLVATHIAAGFRIRRGLAASGDPTDGSDAVLTPDGRTTHAEGDARSASAREQLQAAARAADRARTKSVRADETDALELWRGLVAGRWSLVEHFESDGRRFVVARRNAPEAPDPRALTKRERQVAGFAALGLMNKEIAYGLGLSESSVSTTLTSVRRKLRAPRRSDLIRIIQPDVTEEQLA